MNERLTHYDFWRESASITINSTLITMQIQALQTSLRRLVDQDDGMKVDLLSSELNDVQARPEC